MNLKSFVPTLGMAASFGRHALTYSMGAITMAVAVHAVSPDQGASITKAITDIGSGIASITGGVTTLVAIGSAMYAAYKAAPSSQIKSVAAQPDVAKIVPVVAPDPSSAVAVAAKDPAQPKVG